MEYKKPELEIVLFHEKDVITTSGGGEWDEDKNLEELLLEATWS